MWSKGDVVRFFLIKSIMSQGFDTPITLSMALRLAWGPCRKGMSRPFRECVLSSFYVVAPEEVEESVRYVVDSLESKQRDGDSKSQDSLDAVTKICAYLGTKLGDHPRHMWLVGDVLWALHVTGAISATTLKRLIPRLGLRQLTESLDFGSNDDVKTLYEAFLWKRTGDPCLRWMAFGDWGRRYAWSSLAVNIRAIAGVWGPPSFITAVGDNIYPSGVTSLQSVVWQEWESTLGENADPLIRIPWYLVLGNHDYVLMEDGRFAEVAYTSVCKHQRWVMPSRQYNFTTPLPGGGEVEFFAVDTNGVQDNVCRDFPQAFMDFVEYLPTLKEQLLSSKARWKIVMGHHPCYTGGIGHQSEARCLRGSKYTPIEQPNLTRQGIGFESLLVECGVDVYVAGHEHVTQLTSHRGVTHLVAGAAVETHYYKGKWRTTKKTVPPTDEDEDRTMQMESSCVDWCFENVCCVAMFYATFKTLQIDIVTTATAELVHSIILRKDA